MPRAHAVKSRYWPPPLVVLAIAQSPDGPLGPTSEPSRRVGALAPQVPNSSLGRGPADRSSATGPAAGVPASGAHGPAPIAPDQSRTTSASAATPAALVPPADVTQARHDTAPLSTDRTPLGTGVRAPGAPGLALFAPPASIAAPGSPALMHRAIDAGAGSALGVRHRDPSAPSFPSLPGGLAGLGSSMGASGGGAGGAGGPSAVLFCLFALAVGAGARFVLAGTANRSTAILSLIERPG